MPVISLAHMAGRFVVIVALVGVLTIAPAATGQAAPRVTTPCARVLGENRTADTLDPVAGTTRSGAGSASRSGAGAPSGSLAATGGFPWGMVLAGVVLVVVGGAISLAARPRRRTATLIIGLSILAATGLIVPSRAAFAQTTTTTTCAADPDSHADVPPAVVPEAPLTALLPLSGLVLTGGVLLIFRRRRDPRP